MQEGKIFSKKLAKVNSNSSRFSNPFFFTTSTNFFTDPLKLNKEEINLVNNEMEGMINKGAKMKVTAPGQFLSNIFLVLKKDVGKQACHKFKEKISLFHINTSRWKPVFNKGTVITKRLDV